MNSHNRLHYRPPAAASSAFPYASGGEQSAMVSAGVASCAPRGSIVPEPTKPVPRRVDTNRAVPHPNEPSLTVTAHEPAVPQQSFKPSHTNEPEPCRNQTNPSLTVTAHGADVPHQTSWPVATNEPSRAASNEPEPHHGTARPGAARQGALPRRRIPTVPWTARTKD
jgi:hypothetical protein